MLHPFIGKQQTTKYLTCFSIAEQVYAVLARKHESEAVRRRFRQMRGGEGIRILRHQKNERDPQTGSDKDILNI